MLGALTLVTLNSLVALDGWAQEGGQSKYNNDPFVKPKNITPLTLPDAWSTNIHRDPQNLWRSIARAALVNGDEYSRGLAPNKLRYLFVTHLHEDHTVGIPSLLLNPFKLDIPTPKEIYGPKGTAAQLYVVTSQSSGTANRVSPSYLGSSSAPGFISPRGSSDFFSAKTRSAVSGLRELKYR